SLNSAVNNYNKTVGSLESRVLPSARRFEELKATQESKTIETVEPIDSNARSLQSNAPATADEPSIEPTEDFGFVPGPEDKD
ncbi:MAG: hypothetical protein R3242_07240, partial [Akkermansiaceae bacterium]|nr:hypothetical protein [Akkermansiaceae bacterium]